MPNEVTGDRGVYVEYPADEMWAILSLESHRYQAGIVGENLGTVPPAVNKAMVEHDIRQMYVMQYEVMGNPEKPRLKPPPKNCVASLNTHDMPPFRAFVEGTDIDDRLDLGFLKKQNVGAERRQRKLMRAALEKLGPVGAVYDRPQSREFVGGHRPPLQLLQAVTQFLSDSM